PPDLDEEFTITCDGSYSGLGAVFSQKINNDSRPVQFVSRQLLPSDLSHCVTEIECLSVIFAIQKFYAYIEHTHFTIETDHIALRNMMTMPEPSARVQMWAIRIMAIDCTVVHWKGSTNYVADALSRAPCPLSHQEGTSSRVSNLTIIKIRPETRFFSKTS
ncbi:hypothetical protein B566_EDAN015956, partial [Ephemera danica]